VKRIVQYFCCISGGFLSIANIFTQTMTDSTKKDSALMVYEAKEYEVLATNGYDFTAGIQTIEIPPALLKYNGSMSSLSDALQSIGGIYMRSYGNQMNNAVTLRGFGPERTSVLWNGIALNNAGLGQLDMNLMPGGLFNSIKLIVGSSSTQYGNGAQGGSLLLEYRPDFKNSFNMTLQQEYGSFFSWNTFAQFNYGNKNIQGRTAFIRNSSNNNYAYKDKSTIGFPTRETENAEYFSYQGIQDLFFKLKKNWHLSLHGWYTYTDRKIPPPMGASNNNSQQFDKNVRVMTQLRKSFEKHDIQFQIAYLNDQLIYHTDAFKDSSLIHSGQFQVQYAYKSKIFTLMTGGNFSVNYSEYKYYNTPVSELRGNIFALINWDIRSLITKNRRYRFKYPWYINMACGIRQQFSSHIIGPPSGHVGFDFAYARNKSKLSWTIASNSAYRIPTLNDLFWTPGGNLNLQPEYSWNIETSIKYEIRSKYITTTFDALGFFGRTHNWIQWSPNALLGYWEPMNIPNVQSAGFEGGVDLRIQKNKWNFTIQSKYNYTSALNIGNNFKQLIYVPEHTIKGKVELKWDEIYLHILPQFYSKRYTLTDNTQSIPAFFMLNLQAGYTLKLTACNIGFYCRIGNATHADYQMMINRPMPGLNFNAGLNLNLHTIQKKNN